MITIQQYNEISIRGIEANQTVHGSVRGGHVLGGFFYYPAATNVGILKVKAENYTTGLEDTHDEIAAHQKSFNKEG